MPSLRQPSKRGEPAAGGGQQHEASPWRQVLSVTQRAVPSEPPPWARSHGAAPPRGETDASAQHLSHPMAHDFNGVAGGRGDFTRCVPSMDVPIKQVNAFRIHHNTHCIFLKAVTLGYQ